ncbi:MAG: serine/threonine-protein kinase [Polyangiales bacterium]
MSSEPESAVNASAPTLQGDSAPGKPVLIRTPLPPGPLDAAVGALSSTTTPTGSTARISTTLRSGGGRTLVGQTLGRYEILDELGHGGMATVYRARDPRLERDVALKVIHHHLRDNAEIAQRFRHEARAVAKLKHPSIVEIYDVPDEGDESERFLVAELVEGPSLRKYLSELRRELGEEHSGLFPPELAGALILQVLGALGRAHAEGIVHRDVKPENILIAHGAGPRSDPRSSQPDRPSPTSHRVPPVAKLTDFGIAKILDAQSMTSTGQILGSPAHMAPEQIEAGEISPKVDVFATGVLLYELMTGVLPFDGKNPAQVIRRVLEGQFTPADRVVPKVGGRWNAIIASMLAREPEKRPASVQACEDTIRKELTAMGVSDPDRELVEFMRDPKTVADGWGARLKPRLLERAVAARDAGDVVGSAHDLNRALAYDPNDPKLMRAVTNMRTRERRLRGIRRMIPLLLAAVVVSVGTFGVVRWSRTHTKVVPSNSATITPVPVPTSASAKPSVTASTVPSTKPSIVVPPSIATALITPATSTTASTAPSSGKTRWVKFNFSPAAAYFTIDGGPHLDPLNASRLELAVGTHKLSAVGQAQCCEPYAADIKVEPGETDLDSLHKLKFQPVSIFVADIEGATITAKTDDGKNLGTGKGSLRIEMTETQISNVTITVEGGGKSYSKVKTLRPGNPVYLSEKE